MDLREIRESGLLELYIIGECSQEEIGQVEKAVSEYPELKNDLREIESTLEKYAKIHNTPPSPNLKETLMNKARSEGLFKNKGQKSPSSTAQINWLNVLLGLVTVSMGILYVSNLSKLAKVENEYQRSKILCDSINNESQIQYALIDQLQDASNEIIPISATPKYASTEIYLIHNVANRKNFIQVQSLPSITAQQSFQLWSLKPDQSPIPLTVFQGTEGVFIPVSYEDNTATYAITIEPLGGQDSPTLDKLIGTVTVSS